MYKECGSPLCKGQTLHEASQHGGCVSEPSCKGMPPSSGTNSHAAQRTDVQAVFHADWAFRF